MPRSSLKLDAARGVVVDAPAKVNFYLRVVGRRADGYHLLRSIVAPVSLGDRLAIRPLKTDRVRLRCSDPRLPLGPENLAARAASLLRDVAGSKGGGVAIKIRKRIPVGAGLGGGSSDAAAVLLGLNRLWRLNLPVPRLAKLGATLGADVPVLVHCRPSLVQGIGERVRPCDRFPLVHLALVWPGFPIETRWVYQNLGRLRARRACPADLALRAFLAGRRPVTSILHNDLEPVATRAHRRLIELQEALRRAGALGVRMTGSGSAFFGVFPSAAASKRAAAAIRRQGLWAVAAHTLDRAPEPTLRGLIR